MSTKTATKNSAGRTPQSQPITTIVPARGLLLQLTRWHVGAGGKPLLFLNGIGATSADAAPLLRRIKGREIWTIDMPGTGGSPDCLWPYSPQSMADAVMDVVARFTEGPIDLAGFSWGGALAQQIAGQYSARIEGLILMATSSHIGAGDIGWGAVFDWDILQNSMRLPQASALGLAYQSLAMAGWSSDKLWPRISGHPILIISGSRDSVVPELHGRQLADQLEGAQFRRISGGHLFPFTKAKETAEMIGDFLGRYGEAKMRQAAA